ncbi:hypothetical protein EV363DRAFT_1359319 [Boletus edulis]|nr:hypothetical protein EV363DRAFT_1359319 [Boletus edulis]
MHFGLKIVEIAERKNHLVTGLSGTNDGQHPLPTSIVQNDPSHLHQTGANARIVAYLLQPENSLYMSPRRDACELHSFHVP